MKKHSQECPFNVGDVVCFMPSQRTMGHYQDIERFGIKIGDNVQIESIKEGMYLYFKDGAGGWPWTEFESVKMQHD
jgi:hypothetical protein